MSIQRRLAKLTARRPPVDGPRVIFVCNPGGDPRFAYVIGGENVTRGDGETAAAFKARAMLAAGP